MSTSSTRHFLKHSCTWSQRTQRSGTVRYCEMFLDHLFEVLFPFVCHHRQNGLDTVSSPFGYVSVSTDSYLTLSSLTHASTSTFIVAHELRADEKGWSYWQLVVHSLFNRGTGGWFDSWTKPIVLSRSESLRNNSCFSSIWTFEEIIAVHEELLSWRMDLHPYIFDWSAICSLTLSFLSDILVTWFFSMTLHAWAHSRDSCIRRYESQSYGHKTSDVNDFTHTLLLTDVSVPEFEREVIIVANDELDHRDRGSWALVQDVDSLVRAHRQCCKCHYLSMLSTNA